MKKNLCIFSFTLLAACSAKLLAPTQADVDRVATKYPGYSLAELNKGKTMYEQNCKSCHGLKNPTSRDENQWSAVVPKMVEKVNKKAGTTKIDNLSQQTLIKYLVAMSLAPSK